MRKIKIFISSVQKEFSSERKMLYEYISTDALLGRFFDVFIFENLPASDKAANKVYIDEVAKSDIYLGIFGKEYGYEDAEGFSPTEREFNEAVRLNKSKLVFLTSHDNSQRHSKEIKLIKKAEKVVVRKKFSSPSELKAGVYASLIKYLEDKEFIRTVPFDAAKNSKATLKDVDPERVRNFLNIARERRNFPLLPGTPYKQVFTHLNLLSEDKLTNAALLLFGKQPQKFFITSELKCAHFHGTEVMKPIPSYQVYKGDVFQLVDQAVDFVLAKISVQVGTRSKGTQVPVEYEIPRAVIAEAIVNAVAHRDYTSTGSVQVMLFSDRLEVWNPGQLPPNLTIENLKTTHGSFPANPLLAEPMYLAGYIERIGTGTTDIIRISSQKGLKEPDFSQDDVFKVIIWRKSAGQVVGEVTGEAGGEATGEVGEEVTEEVRRVILVIKGEMKRADIQKKLELKHDDFFRINYIIPALSSGYIEMTHPENPNHPKQKYRLTSKGLAVKKNLSKSKKKK